jgi:hypothetical protein
MERGTGSVYSGKVTDLAFRVDGSGPIFTR